jgi:Ser/Thr protein kinase RdoA (MazF antagonist)
MSRARAAGRLLADRHAASPAEPTVVGLLDYEERPRSGDWGMRSALVRYAQPEPSRAAVVLHLVRRLNTTLHTARRVLEPTTVRCDLSLTMASFTGPDDEPALDEHGEPYDDIRIADLARLSRDAPDDFEAIVDGYAERVPLAEAEAKALPLVMVALEFDVLAEILVAWARTAPSSPPNDEVDATVKLVAARLDSAGVPEETGPPQGGRSRG